MSAPLPRDFRAEMRRHIGALRRAGKTWREVSRLAGLPVPRCKLLAKEPPPLFQRITRIGRGPPITGRIVA